MSADRGNEYISSFGSDSPAKAISSAGVHMPSAMPPNTSGPSMENFYSAFDMPIQSVVKSQETSHSGSAKGKAKQSVEVGHASVYGRHNGGDAEDHPSATDSDQKDEGDDCESLSSLRLTSDNDGLVR